MFCSRKWLLSQVRSKYMIENPIFTHNFMSSRAQSLGKQLLSFTKRSPMCTLCMGQIDHRLLKGSLAKEHFMYIVMFNVCKHLSDRLPFLPPFM